MYWRKSPQKTMTLNLYPDADILAEAFSSVLIDFDWKSYSIVYEKEENLKRLKDVLQIQSPSNNPNKVDVQQLNGNYGALMKQIHESGSLNIVLDISSDNIVPFLLEAKKVQMLTEYTNYFITNLDFHTLDLSSVPNIGSNITSLRLVDTNNEETSNALRLWQHSAFNLNMTENEIPLEAALIHDAVQMFFVALQSTTFGNRKIPRNKNSCDKPSKPKSNFGADLLNHMKSQGHNGTTGEIEFKNIEFKHGTRTQFKLGVLEYTNREFNEIGYWGATDKLQYLRDTSDANKQIIGAIQNKEFKIVVKLGKPFCMIKEVCSV